MVSGAMIDFSRAFEKAWQRMAVILFQPFDVAKWGLIGFNAFLAGLAEGNVSFNNPVSLNNEKTQYHFNSLPDALKAFKDFRTWVGTLPDNPWLKVILCVAAACVVIWLVLSWVGCRGEFVFLDNIVRNRAALAWPWQRYARAGNVWFLFDLGLFLISGLFAALAAGVFFLLNWRWIDAARDPDATELATLVFAALVIFVLGLLGATIRFLVQSLVLPLYFRQTTSLIGSLLAVLALVFNRPLSIFVYLVISLLIQIAAGLISCVVVVAACCVTCWASCYPFIGALLLSLILCELLLPVLVFERCFQLGCLEEFGPEYNVFSVDLAPPGAGPALSPPPPPG
jgi:hypothetical protein